jgi:hypothetical protein
VFFRFNLFAEMKFCHSNESERPITVKNATLASDDGRLSPSSHSVTFNGVIDREIKIRKKMAFESFWEALMSLFVSYIISSECTHLLD